MFSLIGIVLIAGGVKINDEAPGISIVLIIVGVIILGWSFTLPQTGQAYG